MKKIELWHCMKFQANESSFSTGMALKMHQAHVQLPDNENYCSNSASGPHLYLQITLASNRYSANTFRNCCVRILLNFYGDLFVCVKAVDNIFHVVQSYVQSSLFQKYLCYFFLNIPSLGKLISLGFFYFFITKVSVEFFLGNHICL